MCPAEAECVTIQDIPSDSTVTQACKNRGQTQAQFWCSAWVGNLNTKTHSIDSWPWKRVFNCLLFYFVLVWFNLPILLSWRLFQVLLDKRKWSWLMVIFLYDFFSGKSGSWFIFMFVLFSDVLCSWFVSGWWLLFESWHRILIMTSRNRQRVYWEIALC